MMNFRKSIVQFDHKGIKVPYDGCSSYPIEKAKAFYKSLGYEYIGSSNIIYVDGRKNEFPEMYHFFKRT